MKITTQAPTPGDISRRITELETELAAVESAVQSSRGNAAQELMKGADPLTLEQAGATLRARQGAITSAIQTLKRERRAALDAGLVAASTACRKAQDALRGEYRAAELKTFESIRDALDKLDALRVTLESRMELARTAGLAELGIQPGEKEAGSLPTSRVSDGFARQARVVVNAALL